MAIDTAEKRKSAGAVAGYAWIAPGVTPNAAADLAWRQQAGWGYSGVNPAPPAAGGEPPPAYLGMTFQDLPQLGDTF